MRSEYEKKIKELKDTLDEETKEKELDLRLFKNCLIKRCIF